MKKYLIKKLKTLRKLFTKLSYSLWFGVKFESGYRYKRINHSNLDLLEKHHYLLLDMGWEKFTNVGAGFSIAWCWYRMKL